LALRLKQTLARLGRPEGSLSKGGISNFVLCQDLSPDTFQSVSHQDSAKGGRVELPTQPLTFPMFSRGVGWLSWGAHSFIHQDESIRMNPFGSMGSLLIDVRNVGKRKAPAPPLAGFPTWGELGLTYMQ